ncbi:hypothetical protein PRZ48_009670 [Zasmidium cellare]|uniref:Glutathione transferase n=1 Tax=Zasmidium cellare TaxID=395010 RepID=A0ABR0ED89_ZASCE|nr:hypothetical protein PRZ48_009670 [Zasmidium cellare]
MEKYGVAPNGETVTEDLKTKIPPHIRWQAENYNHLHEQPTIFYAVALSLALIGDSHPYTVYAAWGYTGLRILHSLIHATVNKVMARFSVFGTSSVVVAGLTARLAQLVF